MAEIIKGVSPDAEIVVNEHGGKQSKTAYGFHLIDADAILSLAEILPMMVYATAKAEKEQSEVCEEYVNPGTLDLFKPEGSE